MKVLILGGNRFVGKKLASRLLDRGDNVVVFNRKGTGPLGCQIICGDRNDIHDLQKINFDEYDQIIDMCLYNVKQFNLIKPYITNNTPYIFISTAAVFKDNQTYPITEESSVGGMTAFGDYGIDKYLVEVELEKSNINYTILRPTFIDGIESHSPRIDYYINAIKDNKEIPIAGNGENIINIVLDEDVVQSIINVFGDQQKSSYIISNNECITVNMLIDMIAETLDVPVKKIFNSTQYIFPYVHYGIFDNTKFKTRFGQSFKGIKEFLPIFIKK